MNCCVFLFTRDGLIYSSLGWSSPGLEKSLSLSINLSTLCVSCQRWQMTCPSTLCHPVEETRRQSEIISQLQLGERVFGGWRWWWWWHWRWGCVCIWCVCVCVCLFQPPGNRSGDISLLLCTSVSSQMKRLFMRKKEGSWVVGSSQCTWGDREKG